MTTVKDELQEKIVHTVDEFVQKKVEDGAGRFNLANFEKSIYIPLLNSTVVDQLNLKPWTGSVSIEEDAGADLTNSPASEEQRLSQLVEEIGRWFEKSQTGEEFRYGEETFRRACEQELLRQLENAGTIDPDLCGKFDCNGTDVKCLVDEIYAYIVDEFESAADNGGRTAISNNNDDIRKQQIRRFNIIELRLHELVSTNE